MGLRFIFMLTRNDRTVADASQHLQTALSLGVRHIGFKDIGLPTDQLKALNKAIQAHGATSYLEVVSLDSESEIVSARAAVDIGVDVLLGGTRVECVLPILQGSGIQYFPFPGRISGHPSVLEGSIEEIVQSAKAITAHEGVHGLDLLAYRSKEDVPALVKEVGAAGFTIGTAALDGRYPAIANDLPGQLEAIIRDTADLNKHLSPIHKENLAKAFSDVSGLGVPKVTGQINDLQLKLARFDDDSTWSFRQNEDRLFFVHKGRLLMKFRDRDEVLEDGEFIVVPHGVECRPVALDSACDVLLIDSAVKDHPTLT